MGWGLRVLNVKGQGESPHNMYFQILHQIFLRANQRAKGTPGSRLALGTGHCTRQTGSVVVPPDRLSLHTSHPQSPSTDPEYFCSSFPTSIWLIFPSPPKPTQHFPLPLPCLANLTQPLTLYPSLHSKYNYCTPPGPWPNDPHSSLPGSFLFLSLPV